MEKIEKYRSMVQKVIQDYAAYKLSYGDIESQIIIDPERDHYQLTRVGWNDDRRIHGCLIHIDIKDEKIWIQHDGTEIGIANELVALGVPKKDIVLAFHAPYKRQFTGFAVA